MKQFILFPAPRLKVLVQAFFLLCIAAHFLSACLPTDPPLDMTGDLQYTDFVIGAGEEISADTTVLTQIGINFVGKLSDSTIFADAQGQTIYALVGGYGLLDANVTKGLDSALRGMRVGGYRRVIVPPRYGFGNLKNGNVPGNSTLIYDVELRSVERFIREDIAIGEGDSAKVNSTVTVNYIGRLTNGNIFDASTSGNPFSFRLGQRSVIMGWEIGLLGIQPGGKRRLSIPSLLGYGAQGSPPRIPSHATLIFDIEAVSISQ